MLSMSLKLALSKAFGGIVGPDNQEPMTLQELVELAVEIGWFLPPIDPIEFQKLVSARKQQVDAIISEHRRIKDARQAFEPIATDLVIYQLVQGRSWIYLDQLIFRPSTKALWYSGAGTHGSNREPSRDYWSDFGGFGHPDSPNPNLLDPKFPNARTLNPIIFDIDSGSFIWEGSDVDIPDSIWDAAAEFSSGPWWNYFSEPCPENLENDFFTLWEKSSKRWFEPRVGDSGCWKMELAQIVDNWRIEELEEEREQIQKSREKIRRDQKLLIARAKPLKINPLQMLGATKGINEYTAKTKR